MGGLYSGFRRDGAPTHYPDMHYPATYDVTIYGILYCCLAVSISCIAILPGFRGIRALFYFLRVVLVMFVTTSIAANPEYQEISNHSIRERINYNERFEWDGLGWSKGNEGLSDNDGELKRAYIKAKMNGLPYSILWVVEYFTYDGGGFRYGRYYQRAGFYTHCLIWLSLVTWVLTLFAVYMVKLYGGYLALLTGFLLLTANATYAGILSGMKLSIPFQDGRLTLDWGWCFWLCLASGFIALAVGVFIVLADILVPDILDMVLEFESCKDRECVEEVHIEENDNEFFNYDKDAAESIPLFPRCRSIGDSSNPRTPSIDATIPEEPETPGSGILSPISETGPFVFTPQSDLESPGFMQPRRVRYKKVIKRKQTAQKLHNKFSIRRGFNRSQSCPAPHDPLPGVSGIYRQTSRDSEVGSVCSDSAVVGV